MTSSVALSHVSPENVQFSSSVQFSTILVSMCNYVIIKRSFWWSISLTTELSTAHFLKHVLPSQERIKFTLFHLAFKCCLFFLFSLFLFIPPDSLLPPSSLSLHRNSQSSYYYLKYCTCWQRGLWLCVYTVLYMCLCVCCKTLFWWPSWVFQKLQSLL